MTTKETLSEQQQEAILQTVRRQGKLIESAAKQGAIGRSAGFVFFAAFDGTNNDLANAHDPSNTNVAQLYLQAQSPKATSVGLSANYYPGPGTKGTLSRSSWEHAAVTAQVAATARRAYDDFTEQASDWLERNPGKAVSVVLTGFSRGCASAAIFSQMVFEKGVVTRGSPARAAVPPGDVAVSAGVLFDPVMTGVKGNMAFPPNARNVVQIRAQDEYRHLFKAVDYSSQPCVTCIDVLGCHCDVGGSYDNGIAALTLEAATRFFQRCGLPIADVDPARRFSAAKDICVHSEELDDLGNLKWDVYDHFSSLDIRTPSPRLTDGDVQIVAASQTAPSGYAMTLYDGRAISVA